MEKLITFENINCFAYVNLSDLCQPVRGVVIEFFGLGYNQMCPPPPGENDITRKGQRWGREGIVYVFPYNNPWNWMNAQAVSYSDEILTVLYEGLHLSKDIPLIACGGSMGGQSALIFTRYSSHTPAACLANCPVCDMPYHYTERPDLPRTLYSALWNSPLSREEALRAISPLHLANEMPDIDYYIFHCEEDRAVNLKKHSLRFVEKMRPSHRLTFHTVPERGHCQLTDEMWALWDSYILSSIEKASAR